MRYPTAVGCLLAMSLVIVALDGAYRTLRAARAARGTIDLDLPERRFDFASDGTVTSIGLRQALDSHRLIEEFMIAATTRRRPKSSTSSARFSPRSIFASPRARSFGRVFFAPS